MSILYNKVERGNPANPGVLKLWHPILKSTGMIREKEVTKRIADETTLNPKEAEVTATQIKNVNIRFFASETLKDALKKATFTAVESLSK
jgi:hypothetical protein